MSHVLKRFGLLALAVASAIGCDRPTMPASARSTETETARRSTHPGIVSSVAGGGHFNITAPPVAIGEGEFSFTAVVDGDGTAHGFFRQVRPRNGYVLDFDGEVTCVTFDAINHRAWIGGVIRQNRSTDPALQLAIHQPGRDVWFRTVDYGEGAGAPAADRLTVFGFEGSAGITTSPQYCAAQLWPAGDANTFEVLNGNIQMRP
jgi:hypothetical protein